MGGASAFVNLWSGGTIWRAPLPVSTQVRSTAGRIYARYFANVTLNASATTPGSLGIAPRLTWAVVSHTPVPAPAAGPVAGSHLNLTWVCGADTARWVLRGPNACLPPPFLRAVRLCAAIRPGPQRGACPCGVARRFELVDGGCDGCGLRQHCFLYDPHLQPVQAGALRRVPDGRRRLLVLLHDAHDRPPLPRGARRHHCVTAGHHVAARRYAALPPHCPPGECVRQRRVPRLCDVVPAAGER